jgi:hypothetical protein
MPRPLDAARPSLHRLFAVTFAVGVLVPAVLSAPSAGAATESFSESFSGATLGDASDWVSSNGPGGVGFDGTTHPGEPACLTGLASGQTISVATGSIVGCPHGAGRTDAGSFDDPGSGVLRLTDNRFMQSAMVLYNRPQKVSDGLDIRFNFAMHSGVVCPSARCGYDVPGADGFSFFIKDGSNSDDSAGTGGGALGYALERSDSASRGIRGGLLGVGFDFFGAYSIQNNPGLGPARNCPAPAPTITLDSGSTSREAATDRMVLRGPDLSTARDGSCGYEFLGRSADFVDFGRITPTAGSRRLALSAPTRAGAARHARVVIDKPGADARITVYVWGIGQPQPTTPVLDVAQPVEFQNVSTFKFGFSAGTGWATLVHEIWDLQIVLADPVVQAARAEEAAASAPAPAASSAAADPRLVCAPDPVRPGADVTCTVTSGPKEGDILWRASVGDRVIGTLGVTLDADGSGTFVFRVPRDVSGTGVDIELVAWGVDTTVGITGGPLPVRIDAGSGADHFRSGTSALLVMALVLLGAAALRRRTSAA